METKWLKLTQIHLKETQIKNNKIVIKDKIIKVTIKETIIRIKINSINQKIIEGMTRNLRENLRIDISTKKWRIKIDILIIEEDLIKNQGNKIQIIRARNMISNQIINPNMVDTTKSQEKRTITKVSIVVATTLRNRILMKETKEVDLITMEGKTIKTEEWASMIIDLEVKWMIKVIKI